MLRADGKKIDTAFRRLRERRIAVGIAAASETPEQEALRVQREIEAAQATGDISAILRIVTRASSLTAKDFIKKTCGGLLFMYYTYIERLHVVPIDIEDMVDGLLFLDSRNYIMKQATSEN